MEPSRSATGIIGPSVSGLLVATVGVGWVFVIDAATFVVSAFSLLRLHVPRISRHGAPVAVHGRSWLPGGVR